MPYCQENHLRIGQLRATVDTDSLSRMRRTLSRDVAPRNLLTREHFQIMFGYPVEGEGYAELQGTLKTRAWMTTRSPFAQMGAALGDIFGNSRRRPVQDLCTEVSRPLVREPFSEALKKRLPPGGPPLQHLEDALALALQRAPFRKPLSDGATPALTVAEAIYDAMFCATYAYYFEIIHSAPTAMAYGQGYAETISGVALGRKLDGTETYRPILGGGGYYETLEALLTRMQQLDSLGGPLKVHIAPLRLPGGAPDEAVAQENG